MTTTLNKQMNFFVGKPTKKSVLTMLLDSEQLLFPTKVFSLLNVEARLELKGHS